jgi:hypothetical protein
MKVYKYRSLRNFDFIADILCNRRFHTASFFDLNDPMEGLFNCEAGTKQEYIEAIVRGKEKLRVCSFSKDRKNVLLWAHYADGFKGICIEIDLTEPQPPDCEKVTVEYSVRPILFSNRAQRLLSEMPRLILSQKNAAWKYEKEVRILSEHDYIRDGISIKSVLLGMRTPDVLKQAIRRITPSNLPVYETHIDPSNKIEKGQRYVLSECVGRGR